MIGISKLYCGAVSSSDALRYGRMSEKLPSHLLQFAQDKKPVVVWNCTRACNLKCRHCYSNSGCRSAENELNTKEAKHLIKDLSGFKVPVLLFSGGEPLMRRDLYELVHYAVDLGLRAVISTNGTLLTKQVVNELKKVKLSYVGISLDGLQAVNDRFRGIEGAFLNALSGLRNCQQAGIKVGIRFTINQQNQHQVAAMFDLMENEKINRICFYHLVYSGRASQLLEHDLSHEQTRQIVDLIIDRTERLYRIRSNIEVLTVDNHCDGPYLYLRLLQEKNKRAQDVLKLLQYNQGNSSGLGIGCVSWDGQVHADQFFRHYSFGNVRQKPFSRIWQDRSIPLLNQLKQKKNYVTGRCAQCKWLDICAGNFRARAEAATGDLWAPDPACYLTDAEIGILN